MAAQSFKSISYLLLIVATCLLSSVVAENVATNRESKQLLGLPYPYYPNYVPAAGLPFRSSPPAGIPYYNKPGNRQSPGWERPTYVGVFPVLTGQQACPVCQNCSASSACSAPAPSNSSAAPASTASAAPASTASAASASTDSAASCQAPPPTDSITTCGGGSASPKGTIKFTTTSSNGCDYYIVALAPNTKITVNCASKGVQSMIFMPSVPEPNLIAVTNTDFPSASTAIRINTSLSTTSLIGGATTIDCTWTASQ